MFVVPLSVRNNLNFLARYTPRRSRAVVAGDTLFMLLWDEEYLELVAVPLLAQAPETSVAKALFILDAAVTVSDGVVHVFAISKSTFYHSADGLNTLAETEHTFLHPEISAWGSNAVVFSKNTFYQFTGDGFRNLRISPYFRTITSYSCGHSSGSDVVLYQTNAYTSVYALDGTPVLKKHPCMQQIFISDGKLFVHSESEIFLYEIHRGLKLLARIDINVRIDAAWSHMEYHQGMLYMSGTSKDGHVLYADGYLFSTDDLVQSFGFYRNCFFGVGCSSLYFLPNDRDFDLRLLDGEVKVLDSVLGGGAVSQACRSFNSLREFKRGGSARVGYFLGVLVYHGFRIECRKLLCNALNDLQRSGDVERIRVLREAAEFGYKIYRLFMNMDVDADRIYGRITEIVDPEAINKDLLTKMAEISFRDIDILCSPKYFLLKGRKLLEQGDAFMDSFLRCQGLFEDVARILEDHDKVQEIVVLWKTTGFCSGTSFERMCRHDLASFELDGRDVMECICAMWMLVENRHERVGNIARFINGRYDLLDEFVIPDGLQTLLPSEIVKRCHGAPSEASLALPFLMANGREVEASMLHYNLFVRTGIRKHLEDCLKSIHDSVFVYEGRFVGRESLETSLERPCIDYRAVLAENTRRVGEMADGCVWTEVMQAERHPKEYAEYLHVLRERHSLNFR